MILHILLTVRRFTECFCGWVRIFPDNICRSQRTASVWRNKERYVCNEKNFDTEKIRHCSFSIEKDPILYRRNFKNIYIELRLYFENTRDFAHQKILNGNTFLENIHVLNVSLVSKVKKKKIRIKLGNFVYRIPLLLYLIYIFVRYV